MSADLLKVLALLLLFLVCVDFASNKVIVEPFGNPGEKEKRTLSVLLFDCFRWRIKGKEDNKEKTSRRKTAHTHKGGGRGGRGV